MIKDRYNREIKEGTLIAVARLSTRSYARLDVGKVIRISQTTKSIRLKVDWEHDNPGWCWFDVDRFIALDNYEY